MIPGTSGRFNRDHSDGGLCRTDLSSSGVDVSCNRRPPPGLSQREGKFLARRAQLTRATVAVQQISVWPHCRISAQSQVAPTACHSFTFMKLQLRIESAAIFIAICCGMLRRIAFTREDDTEPEDMVAAVPKSGTPDASSALPVAAQAEDDAQRETERAPGRRLSARRLLAAAA